MKFSPEEIASLGAIREEAGWTITIVVAGEPYAFARGMFKDDAELIVKLLKSLPSIERLVWMQ